MGSLGVFTLLRPIPTAIVPLVASLALAIAIDKLKTIAGSAYTLQPLSITPAVFTKIEARPAIALDRQFGLCAALLANSYYAQLLPPD